MRIRRIRTTEAKLKKYYKAFEDNEEMMTRFVLTKEEQKFSN